MPILRQEIINNPMIPRFLFLKFLYALIKGCCCLSSNCISSILNQQKCCIIYLIETNMCKMGLAINDFLSLYRGISLLPFVFMTWHPYTPPNLREMIFPLIVILSVYFPSVCHLFPLFGLSVVRHFPYNYILQPVRIFKWAVTISKHWNYCVWNNDDIWHLEKAFSMLIVAVVCSKPPSNNPP